MKFWHRECVCGLSVKKFAKRYAAWRKKRVTTSMLTKHLIFMHLHAARTPFVLCSLKWIDSHPCSRNTMLCENFTVGEFYCFQLIAEIGSVDCFSFKKAGIAPPPRQSGAVNVHSHNISNAVLPLCENSLSNHTQVILQNCPENEPVYQFHDKKCSEWNLYKVYMIAAAKKFLLISYAQIKECLNF